MRVTVDLVMVLADKQVFDCHRYLGRCLPEWFKAAGQKVMNEVATAHNARVRLSHRDVRRIFRLQVSKGSLQVNKDAYRRMLAEVRGDITVVEESLAQLRVVENYYLRKLDSFSSAAVTDEGAPRAVAKKANYREIAAGLIEEQGTPLRAGEIATLMLERGLVQVADKRALTNSVFVSLNRDTKRFVKAGPGLWALVKEA